MRYIGLVNIGPFLSYYEQNISFSLYGKINGTFITIKWIGAVIDFGLLATLLIGIIKCYPSSLLYLLHYRFLVCVELLQPNYDYSFTFITNSKSPLQRSIFIDSLVFPFSPGLLLFVLSFQTFLVVSQLPRAKSVPPLIILIVPTNWRYKSMQSETDDFTIFPICSLSFTLVSPFCRKSLLSNNSDFAQTIL